LIEALEDSDDVQNVWANFDVSDEVMAKVGYGQPGRLVTVKGRAQRERLTRAVDPEDR
jgi:hypothetical protein